MCTTYIDFQDTYLYHWQTSKAIAGQQYQKQMAG